MSDSEKARAYIYNFCKYIVPGISNVTYHNLGKTIYFDNMTDEEAIMVAAGMANLEIDAARNHGQSIN